MVLPDIHGNCYSFNCAYSWGYMLSGDYIGIIIGGEMKKRKGWDKKARDKFVRKRVFVYKYGDNETEIAVYGNSREYTYYSKDDWYQRVRKVGDRGFTRGFWYARGLGKKNIGYFSWNKKLKDGE